MRGDDSSTHSFNTNLQSIRDNYLVLVSSFLSISLCVSSSRSELSALVIRVVGCRFLQVVSRAQVRGVRWLSRIDQEGFFGVRFLEGAEGCFLFGLPGLTTTRRSRVSTDKGSWVFDCPGL